MRDAIEFEIGLLRHLVDSGHLRLSMRSDPDTRRILRVLVDRVVTHGRTEGASSQAGPVPVD